MSEAWDGRPPSYVANMEGWHWLTSPDGKTAPYRWSPDGTDIVGAYAAMWWGTPWSRPDLMAADGWRYLGPCMDPETVSVNMEVARREALQQAARVARKVAHDTEAIDREMEDKLGADYPGMDSFDEGYCSGAMRAAENIEALISGARNA